MQQVAAQRQANALPLRKVQKYSALDRPKRAYLVYGVAPARTVGRAADAVLAGGGKVIGVIPDVKLIQERRHPGLTGCIETKDMAERKRK